MDIPCGHQDRQSLEGGVQVMGRPRTRQQEPWHHDPNRGTPVSDLFRALVAHSKPCRAERVGEVSRRET